MSNSKTWIEEIKQGDTNALSKLIHKHQDLVFNTVISIVQNSEDAQEITQDVFIEVFHSANKFRGDSKVSTWIYRIANNKSLDHLKKKKRKKRFAFMTSLFDPNSGRQLFDQPNFEHPGILLEQKENAKYLFAAIDNLPDKQKQAYILNKIEGVSNKEISDIMNMSISSIDSLLHRAKANLRLELEEFYNKMNE